MKAKNLHFLSFSLLKYRKYLPRSTSKIFLHEQSPEILPNLYLWAQKIKKCRYTREFISSFKQNPIRIGQDSKLCSIILYLIKCFKQSLQHLPLSINKSSFYKCLRNLKSLKIIDNNWADWRATRYNNRVKHLLISDVEQSESSFKLDVPFKEKYFQRFLHIQRKLETICFKVAMKLEYYRYLSIIEENISSLKSFKALDLDFKFQVSGLSISRHRLSHLFQHIRTFKISEPPLYFLKLCNSGSELESFTGEWLQEPKTLSNLKTITIKMRNDLPASWKFFQSLQVLNHLQEFNLSLHKPNVMTLKSMISAMVLPQTLTRFSFKLYSVDLSSIIRENNWPEENPFEISPYFESILNCVANAKNLKKLKLHLTYTNFKSFYTGFIISLCKRVQNLQELSVKVQEIFPAANIFMLEDFRFDMLCQQIPETIQRLWKLSIAAPHISMKEISSSRVLKMNNLLEIKLNGNTNGPENQKGLLNLLKASDPRNIVVRGQILEEESHVQEILMLLYRMKRLKCLNLEFQTNLIRKKDIMIMLCEKLRNDIQVSITFGAPGEYSREMFEVYVRMCGKGRCNPLLTLRGGQIQYSQETIENRKRVFYVDTASTCEISNYDYHELFI